MQAWQTTRNTLEAAALHALDIQVQPVTMTDHKTHREYTDWNLDLCATQNPERHTREFITGALRREAAEGRFTGSLATQPLHPYRIALRTLGNRHRFLEAQKGHSMQLVEDAPGQWSLRPGPSPAAPLAPVPYIDTHDADLAITLITLGHPLLSIEPNGQTHRYKLHRYGPATAEGLRTDAKTILEDHRSGAYFPVRRWEPHAISLHTLHCLRVLRRHQHSNQWIAVKHRTHLVKGAAIPMHAPSASFAHAQQKLAIKIG